MSRDSRVDGCPEFRAAPARRDFLKAGALGTLGLGLGDFLRLAARADGPGNGANKPPVKSVIVLQKYGAPSHVDTWDMKPRAAAEIRSEFSPIGTPVPGYFVCEHMPRIARLVDKMTVVRSFGHTVGNHNPATYFMLTGRTSEADIVQVGAKPSDWPNPGAVVSKLRPGDGKLPESVILPHLSYDQIYTCPRPIRRHPGQEVRSVRDRQDPNRPDFSVKALELRQGVSVARLGGRRRLLEEIDRQHRQGDAAAGVTGMDQYYHRAWSILTSPQAKRAFDIRREPAAGRERYGRHKVGQSMLLARRLVEAGVRFVTCYHGLNPGDLSGWDTHRDNFNGLKKRLLPPEDRGFAALVEDLEERGLLDSTLVVWCGEFGRSPRIGKADVTKRIAPAGRDHWPFAYSIALLGGGVKRGYICGKTDNIGGYPIGKPYTPADLAATIFWALGIDPHTEIRDQLGRPFKLAEGRAAKEWFA